MRFPEKFAFSRTSCFFYLLIVQEPRRETTGPIWMSVQGMIHSASISVAGSSAALALSSLKVGVVGVAGGAVGIIMVIPGEDGGEAVNGLSAAAAGCCTSILTAADPVGADG